MYTHSHIYAIANACLFAAAAAVPPCAVRFVKLLALLMFFGRTNVIFYLSITNYVYVA